MTIDTTIEKINLEKEADQEGAYCYFWQDGYNAVELDGSFELPFLERVIAVLKSQAQE